MDNSTKGSGLEQDSDIDHTARGQPDPSMLFNLAFSFIISNH